MNLLLSFLGAAVGAITGAVVTGYFTHESVEQRETAARREEWWRRFCWAADLVLDADEARRAAGLHVLTSLAASPLAGEDELRAVEIFSQTVLGDLPSTTVEDVAVVVDSRRAADKEGDHAEKDDRGPAR